MNAQTKIEPFDAFAAYSRERAYSRQLEKALSASLNLLSTECDRRELRGEDVAHIRAFVSRQREIWS